MMNLFQITRLQLQLIQCIIAGTKSANTSSSQVQRFQFASIIYNTDTSLQNYTKCPMWYNYSLDTHACECFSLWILKCDGTNTSIIRGQMLTYDLISLCNFDTLQTPRRVQYDNGRTYIAAQ